MEQPAASSPADRAAIEALARPIFEAADSAASADELRRLLEAERIPAHLRERLLQVLLWNFLHEGILPALAAVLRAGGKNWDSRGRYAQEAMTRKGEWYLRSHVETAISLMRMPFFKAWGARDDIPWTAIFVSFFGAGAPADPIFEELRREVYVYAQQTRYPDDIYFAAEKALWWSDLLHLRAPAGADALMGALHRALARGRDVRAVRFLGELSQLRVQLAGWRALRVAWIGAVVRSAHRR